MQAFGLILLIQEIFFFFFEFLNLLVEQYVSTRLIYKSNLKGDLKVEE